MSPLDSSDGSGLGHRQGSLGGFVGAGGMLNGLSLWNRFLEEAIGNGFSVGLKWGKGYLTYTVHAPSGAPFGRGFKMENPANYWLEALTVFQDSARKTIDYIEKIHPDEMTLKSEGKEEQYLK